jgi:hypothetical protein
VTVVQNLLAIALKLTFVSRVSIIIYLAHILLPKMVAPKENIVM